MLTSSKRRADEDDRQAASTSPTKKTRPSGNNAGHTTSSAYSSVASTETRYSSTNNSQAWNPAHHLSSSSNSVSNSYGFQSAGFQHASSNDDDEDEDEERPSFGGVSATTKNAQDDATSTLPTDMQISKNIMKMMQKQNYDPKRGLGLNAVAPTKLIEESKQRGRRGFGFSYQQFKDEEATWNFDDDPAPVEEEVFWCPHPDIPEPPLNVNEMYRWIQLGLKKDVIDDEYDFVDEDILRDMLSAKTIFDTLPAKEMEEARARSNVYEIIGQSIFLNRAAVKMANIDSVFGRMFTEPKTRDDRQSLVHPDEPFYFADVCAGPGGFSEYMLWKKKWRAKGFGFTLKGESDFKLQKFLVGPPETFDPFYGVGGIDGDGDVFKTENIDEFQRYVLYCTRRQGVHIMMADGGFSVEGQENIQEILSKQLYLCQFLTALSIVRPEGHFVCKLFDLFTPFSIGLIYLMYRAFAQISIHKPVTSRPANSERYIICRSLRASVRDVVRTYMHEINKRINELKSESSNMDILSIVPMDILRGNEGFYKYIRDSNNRLGSLQIRNLQKIRAFVSNVKLRDDRQHEIRSQCLALWELPDEPRQKFQKLNYNDLKDTLFSQLGDGIDNILLKTPNPLRQTVLNEHQIQSLFDYRCILSLGDPVLLISCGRDYVFALDLKKADKRWIPVKSAGYRIELPPYTLLLAERVQETFSDARNGRSKAAFYIIDAYFIANENLVFQNGRPTIFTDRYRLLKLFEKSINKPCRTDLVPIRVSEQLRLEKMDEELEKLRTSRLMDQLDNERLEFVNTEVENTPRVPVRGLWIFKFVQYPWTLLFGKTHNTKFFHNHASRESLRAAPNDNSHVAGLRSMYENSFYWDFKESNDPVSKSSFVHFIREKNRQVYSQQQH